MTQCGADCSGTCFNRWSRLESVITLERGLEERGCLPGAVWSPYSSTPKSQLQDINPSMSGGRPGEELRGENSERNPSVASHSASTLLSCLPGTSQLSPLFYTFFPLLLQCQCLLLYAVSSKFLMLLTARSWSLYVGIYSGGQLCSFCSQSVLPVQQLYVCVQGFIVFPLNDRNSLHRKFFRLKGLEGSTFH